MSALKKIGSSLLILIGILIVYGVFIEPRVLLDTQTFEAEVPDLPSSWEGQTVALLADLQVGMWFDNTGMVEETVEEAIEADPALVLIAGDFVYKPDTAVVREAVALVRPLAEAGIPTYAVLGNHDYSLMDRQSQVVEEMAAYLTAELEAAGIRVLENERAAVTGSAGEAPLHVVGLGSTWAGRTDVSVVSQLPAGAPRIVFMHNPIVYRDLPADSSPMTLAGHTHGGQVRLPFTPTNNWLDIVRDREVIADGWATDDVGAAGNRLYVTRGLGFSAVPMRVFCRPELTLFTLRGAERTLPERGPNA